MISVDEMLALLHADVVPAVGCTEPACVAVAAADAVCTARSDGARPAPIASIRVRTSPNIYKNGMSVGIPGYAGVGLDAAAALGALIAAPEAGLAIFGGVTPAIAAAAEDLCARGAVEVAIDEGAKGVYACVEVETGGATGRSVVSGGHTNVVERFRNGERVWEASAEAAEAENTVLDRLKEMRIADILHLVEAAPAASLAFVLDGVEMNERAAQADAAADVGVGIFRVLEEDDAAQVVGCGLAPRIACKVAAATEARLGGGMLPCMSSSGAGTKGLVVTIPVAEAARAVGATPERTAQAVAFAHLVNRYINLHVGKLAAVCTCVAASDTAAAAAMAWLFGANEEGVGLAIRNMVGTVTGMVCDGGKVGCALKVSMASSAAVTSALLAARGVGLRASDGVCAETPEQSIRNMARVGTVGMRAADAEILSIMLDK